MEYHDYMDKRSKLQIKEADRKTLRTLLATVYQKMINSEHGEIAKKRF